MLRTISNSKPSLLLLDMALCTPRTQEFMHSLQGPGLEPTSDCYKFFKLCSHETDIHATRNSISTHKAKTLETCRKKIQVSYTDSS